MRIANPIYDVVFKYLLDDEKAAKLVLSALLGKEVLELQFRATEVRREAAPALGPAILVLRMDFAATLALEDGSRKLVLIEIQKARSPMDVLRFRRYLGTQYANEENVYLDGTGRKTALPLVTIYFLGEGLDGIDAPVVKINRHYTDAATGEEIPILDPFVEALTHDSIVVQIDRLHNRRRTDLEQLLMVFDQGQARRSDLHLLDILEENFPERYREVLRRLMRASSEQDIREGMDVEDEVLTTLQDHVRESAELRRTLEEKDKTIEAKDKTIEEQERALEEKARALERQDRLIEDLQRRLGRG